MKPMKKHFIYGFRDAFGRFLYVGQTKSPGLREYTHRRHFGKTLEGASFQILRIVNFEQRFEIEGQIIKALRRKGQCQLNGVGGRKQMDPIGKVEQLCLRLTPTLIGRLKRIRGKGTWPEAVESMVDKWERHESTVK